MRTLRTAKNIASNHFHNMTELEALSICECIREAQRDAIEFAMANVKWSYDDNGYPDLMPIGYLHGFMAAWSLRIDTESILKLIS